MANTTIGIQLYSLSIVKNLNAMNLSWIQDAVPRKPHVKHFILVEEALVKPAERDLIELFSEIWSKSVLNSLIIYWNRTLSAVTFTPFPKIRLLFIPKSDLYNPKVLFPDKTRNLHGYPLKVTAFYDISRAVFDRNQTNNLHAINGLDGLLIRLIVDKMNATLSMSEPVDNMQIGELFPNKTATGCLADLMSGEYDMGLNMRFYRLDHFEGKVEATHSNGRDDICFLVPRKGKSIDIANLFRPFCPFTWFAVFAALPCYVFIFYVLTIQRVNMRSFHFHLFQFFGYMLQQPIPFIVENWRQRILIAFWVVSVLFMAFLYQGNLSGAIIIPKDQPNIKNIEELANSDLKIVSFPRYNGQIKQFFSDPEYNDVYEPLFKRLINSSISEFLELVQRFDPSYGFANKNHVNRYLRRVYTLESRIFFHQIPQCPVPFLGVYGIRLGTPYGSRIDFIIRQAQECGLMEKWERINNIDEQKTQASLNSGDGNVPFSLVHLQTAFLIYFAGCVIAFAVFCMEIIHKQFTT